MTAIATPDLDIRTETNQGHSNEDVAHIVPQFIPGNDISTAIVMGTEVTAMCGYQFIPYRQPEGRPVCKPCSDQYGLYCQVNPL